MPLEHWSPWKIFVDDFIELVGIFEGQSKSFNQLVSNYEIEKAMVK